MKKQALDEYSDRQMKLLRKRFELEMQLRREPVHYDPEDPNPYDESKRERREAVHELMRMQAEFGETDGDPIRSFSHVSYEIGGRARFTVDVTCDFEQWLRIKDATYYEGLAWGVYERGGNPPKGAEARTDDDAQANAPGHVEVGYDTYVDVPAANGVTTVTITSEIAARFFSARAVATGSNGSGFLAFPMLLVLGTFGVESVTAGFLVKKSVHNGTFTLTDMAKNKVIQLTVSVPPGPGETLQVREIIALEAYGGGGSADIAGGFNWMAVGVWMIEGCASLHSSLMSPRSIFG